MEYYLNRSKDVLKRENMTKGKEDGKLERRKKNRRDDDTTCGACFSEDFDMLSDAFYALEKSYTKLSSAVKTNGNWYTWAVRILILAGIAGTGIGAISTYAQAEKIAAHFEQQISTDGELETRVSIIEFQYEDLSESMEELKDAVTDLNEKAEDRNKLNVESNKMTAESNKLLRDVIEELK